MSDYRYHGAPEQRVFGPLPPGDYAFSVASCDEPYQAKSGNLVLPLKINILPQGIPVFANPWCGTDKNGEERDSIAEFLLCINRAPAIGQEPQWAKLVGAKGKVRLKVEIAEQGTLAGKEVNKVAFFHRPKEIGPATKTQASVQQHEQAQQEVKAAAGGTEFEPDDIPF